MNKSREAIHFNNDVNSYLGECSHEELIELAKKFTVALGSIIQNGFSDINEGFDPEAGTKPIILVREKLLAILSDRLNFTYSADELEIKEAAIVFDFFKSENQVDVAIKALQDKLRLIGTESSIKIYIDFTNALEKTIHGGVTAKEPLFIKSKAKADTLFVIFAGMVCFPEFKKSVGYFENVDQLHILDPKRCWYMQSPEGDWNGYTYYSSLLKERINQLQTKNSYKKICFMGNSMGASAACLYSQFADAVLAFCPQTEIVRDTIAPEISEKYRELLLQNLQKAHSADKTIMIHRGVAESDIKQCSRLPKNITPIVHEECKAHNVPGYLKSKGILLEVIASVL